MNKLLNNKLIKKLAPALILFSIGVMVFVVMRASAAAKAGGTSIVDALKGQFKTLFSK